jgi:hypothetical protein
LFSMPSIIRDAAAAGDFFATLSKRSIASERRALSVMPLPLF